MNNIEMETKISTELLPVISKLETDKICRSCFSYNEITNIFDLVYEQMNLSDIIRACFAVQIDRNDGFPQNICKWCISETIRSYTFRLQYQQSDVILRSMLNTQNLENSPNFVKTETSVISYEDTSTNIEDISDNIETANDSFETDTNCNNNEIKVESEIIKEEYNCTPIVVTTNEEACSYTSSKPNSVLKKQSNEKFKCNICNRLLSSKHYLKQHSLKHGEKQFLCTECGKYFSTTTGLRHHMKVHTGAKPYHCSICSKKFTQPGSLKLHMFVHSAVAKASQKWHLP